ncbi:hypothetical protein, partial [Mesorhizobium sp. M7A.F.Ca.CA.002.09.1.1]|uniref:hypothetical protein n=1 Tax=Mesorhizobium sp. M7A.F.Ca.CA.002.09.1.1 TaxID=2496739 RepID=UPI0019D234D3
YDTFSSMVLICADDPPHRRVFRFDILSPHRCFCRDELAYSKSISWRTVAVARSMPPHYG